MSQDLVTGIVEKITEKKTAKGTFYSINVDGDWFGFGKEAPEFGEGSEIEFEVRVNGDFENVDLDTIEVLDLVEPEKKSRGSRGGNRGGSRGGRGNKSGGSTRGGSSRGRGRNDDDDDADEDDKPAKSRGSRGGKSDKPAKGGDKPAVDWDLKDEKIQWQAARNSAIELAKIALQGEALKLPAKAADKLDALEAYVQEKTEQFFRDVSETVWKD